MRGSWSPLFPLDLTCLNFLACGGVLAIELQVSGQAVRQDKGRTFDIIALESTVRRAGPGMVERHEPTEALQPTGRSSPNYR